MMVSSQITCETHTQAFDKKTGKPLGDGLGDLFDRSISIFENQQFSYVGDYTFKVKQFMRMEYLPGVHSFGLKV